MDQRQRGRQVLAGVLTELKNRGVRDILIACVDGLRGFPQAIESVCPEARVQTCIVHLVRASLNYVNWKERKQVAADLKAIYRAATEQQAEQELSDFIAKWGHKYQAIGRLWKENWERVIPFFQFPAEIRRVSGSSVTIGQQSQETACGSKEFGSPPFPFPPSGASRGGRVPPTPEHVASQPKALARVMLQGPMREARS